MSIEEEVRKRLKDKKRINGCTLNDLHRETGYSEPYLSQILNGKRDKLTVRNLDMICKVLKVKPSSVLRAVGR